MKRAQSRQQRVANRLVLLVFAVLFVYPIVRLLLLPWFPALGPTPVNAVQGAHAHLALDAVANTVRLALLSTSIAVPLGLVIAWFLERRRSGAHALFTLTLWLVFLTPSYLLTTGWQIVFSMPRLHHSGLAHLFFAQPGIVALLALKALPFAVFAARASWRAIGADILDATRLHLASWWQRQHLLIRLLLPAAGSAFAVVFVESVQEFGIPATLGAQIHLPILTYAIYQRLATTPVDFANAALLSWASVALAGGAAVVHLYLARRGGAIIHGRHRHVGVVPCTRNEALIAGIGGAVLFAFGIAIPGAAIVHAALGQADAAAAVPVAWNSLAYSTFYAGAAALLGVVFAMLLLAQRRQAGGLASHFAQAMNLANMAIPGLVLGAAYAIAFNSRLLPLYGTPALLVLAYVATQVPMLVRFLQAPMAQVHASLVDAARIHRLPWATRALEIHAPLLLSPFLWGWTMAFGQIFFELPVSELLYPAGAAPVGVALVSLNQYLRYAEEARLALIGIVLCAAVAAVVAGLAHVAVMPDSKERAL